ncbi:MAG: glycosyltransferase [Acidobacteria bacterium]|nr:glycosyltransferase [Acidobacteriota bacterium]
MKIGVLGPFPPFRGGISNFDAELVRNLPETVDGAAFNYTRLYPRLLFPGKTPLDTSRVRYPGAADPVFDPYNPLSWRRGRRRIAAEGLDVLLLSWWTPFFAPFLLRFLGPLHHRAYQRLLLVCHNVEPHEPVPLGRFFQRRLFRLADAFIAHWEGDAGALARAWPHTPVCRLFVPRFSGFPDTPGLTRMEARERLGLPGAAKIVLFFGIIRKYKGLDVLLQAFETLAAEHPDLFLVVAGEFYDKRRDYQTWIAPLERAGRIRVTDAFVPNEAVEVYVKASDVAVLPYHHATQSGVIPLVYQWGRGVVTTRVGGLAETVDDGVSGILVPPGDPRALAGAILAYLQARDRFESAVPATAARFTPRRYVEGLLRFIGAETGPAGRVPAEEEP